MSLVARGSVDIRTLNKNSSWCPLRLGLRQEETPDAVAGIRATDASEMTRGIGHVDTSETIRAKTSTTRPARKQIFEHCMFIGPAVKIVRY